MSICAVSVCPENRQSQQNNFQSRTFSKLEVVTLIRIIQWNRIEIEGHLPLGWFSEFGKFVKTTYGLLIQLHPVIDQQGKGDGPCNSDGKFRDSTVQEDGR
jgi:hypothetical protein